MEDEDDAPLYVPIKQRRAAKLQAASGLAASRADAKRPRGIAAEPDEAAAAAAKKKR